MFERIKYWHGCAKRSLKRLAFLPTMDFEYEGKQYKVVISDDEVGMQGFYPYEPIAFLMNNIHRDDHNTIYVNTGFTQLSVEHQQAILMHEIGHSVLHSDLKKCYGFKGLVQTIVYGSVDVEFEADKYALDKGYDIIGALEELLKLHKGVTAKRDFKARLNRLKSSIN